MNKYLLLTVISMLFMGTVFSQQKVKDRTVEGNTLPNGNAILELESTNKGLLHTRVMLTGSSDAAPLSQHVAGMMVYNTATTNDVVPGIYYNDGTKWVLAGAVANGANGITYDPISYEITYIDDEGDPQTIDLSEVIKANETVTALVDNGDGTYTYTNEAGATTLIDVPGSVADNFEDILGNPNVQALLDEFIKGKLDGAVTFDGVAFSYVDGDGNPQVLTLSALVQANETVTTLIGNGDGTYSYTSEDGTVVTFDANTSTVTDNGDGTYTITSDDGTAVTIDIPGDVLTEIQDNTSDIHNEVLSLINNQIAAGSDALVDNGDGTFTHTAVDGTVVTFDANTSTVTDNGDGTYTITNADGTTVTIDVVGDVLTELQDNTSGIHTEILTLINNQIAAGSDALVDNGDGTFTHTAVDGTVVTFDANTSTITDNGDGTYTVTNVDGTTVTIDVPGDVLTELQDNTSDIYNEIQNIITAGSDVLVDNGDGTFTHTAVDGTVVTFDANTSTITDNGDGTYTVTNVDGTTVTIDVVGDVLTELQDNTSDIHNEVLSLINNEVIANSDALVDNGDGTFTHTAVDGTVVTFDANTSTVTDNGDGTYTITNADGTTATIDVAGDVLTELQDNTSDIHNEVLSLINNEIITNSDALVDNGNGTFTHTAVDGTVVTFDANTSTITDNGDGTYTVTNVDGTSVTIDVAGDVLTELQDNTSDIHNEVLSLINNEIIANSDALVDNGDGTFTHTAVDGTVVTFDANTSTITDNGDGTYTVTNVDGTSVTIDVAGDVLTELQDNTSDIHNEVLSLINNEIIANSDALVDNGDGTFTHTAVDGTVVNFDANTSTITDNGDGTYTVTNVDGTTVTIDVPGDVLTELQDNTSDIHNEVLSLINNEIIANSDALVDNGDGTFTHTAVDGTVVTFDANTSTITDNGDGTYTVNNVDGTTVTIDVAGDVLTELQDNTSDIYTEVLSLINNEIIANSDALVDNGDGTFTHTAVDGTVVTFDANTSTITDNGDGTYTVTNVDGTSVTIDVAGDVLTELQDNTSDIYTEVLSLINNEIIANSDALVDNGDGTFTHTAVDGTVVTFDANTSTVTDNGDGTYTVTNVDGTTVTIDVAGDVLTELQDNTSDIYTEIQNIISANSDALVDNGDGTFTHTAVDGTVVSFDANTSTITDNGDGTYTVTNVDGTTVTIDVAGDVLTELQDNTSDIHNEILTLIGNEIVANSDVLVDNGDGTFTHTAADGTPVTFDATRSGITENGDGTYTVIDQDGNPVTIDVAGDVLTELQDNTSDIYTEVVNVIETNETKTTLAIDAGSLAYTNEDSTNPDVNLISTDAENALVAGTDGALFVPETESINIYNANGTLTDSRQVALDGNSLTFQGEGGYLEIENQGSHMTLHGANPDRARFQLSTDDLNGNGTSSTFEMSLFSDNYLQMFALGEMGGISFGTHTTLNPSPIEFLTSPGGGALGEARMTIDGDGNINFTEYPNTRDDSGDSPASNILYTDGDGNLLSAPVANLAVEPWQVQATTNQATDNAQDIYQTGSVAIGTDDIPDLIVDGDDLTSTVKLHVDGNITTSGKLYTTNSMYADYVFEKYFNGHSDLNTTYELASLNDVKSFIKKNHHLPGVTRIADLSKSAKGYTFDLTSLSIQQLEKIEELFIHTIEQQELLDKQQEQLKRQQEELDELKDRLAKIERLLNQQ